MPVPSSSSLPPTQPMSPAATLSPRIPQLSESAIAITRLSSVLYLQCARKDAAADDVLVHGTSSTYWKCASFAAHHCKSG